MHFNLHNMSNNNKNLKNQGKINPNDSRYTFANNPSNPYSPAYQNNPKVPAFDGKVTPNDSRYDEATFDTARYGPAAFEKHKETQIQAQGELNQIKPRPQEDKNHKFNIPQQQNQIGKNYKYGSSFNPQSIYESTNLEESKEAEKDKSFSKLSINESKYISNSQFNKLSKPKSSTETKKSEHCKK